MYHYLVSNELKLDIELLGLFSWHETSYETSFVVFSTLLVGSTLSVFYNIHLPPFWLSPNFAKSLTKNDFTSAVFTSTLVQNFWKKKWNLPFDYLTEKGLSTEQKRNILSFSFLLIKALCRWNFVITVTPSPWKEIKYSSISSVQNGIRTFASTPL